MAAIFDVRNTQTLDYIRTGLVLLPDLENMGITVGILLPSCIRSEIYVTSYLLSVNGRHFEFTGRFLSVVIAVISGNSAVIKKHKIHHCIVHHWSTLLDIMMSLHSEINIKKLHRHFVLEVATG